MLSGPAGDAKPQWHPSNPELIYHPPANGVGMRVLELDISTGTTRVASDLASRIKALWLGANAAWTQSEGSASADARYWCLTWSAHSDLALDANGDDVHVSVDYQSGAGDIFMLNLRTGVRTALFANYGDCTATALHVSGKAFRKPGWVLVSTYAENGAAGLRWLHRKVMAVQLAADPAISTLAHHRSIYNGYWTEPHAGVNRDFTRILSTSNWQSGSAEDVDAYMVEITPTLMP